MPFTHDIFISYGHLDDGSPFGQDKGWVDLLHERLSVLVGQALGYEPNIWRDGHNLQGNDELTGAIGEGITRSLLLVPIITPRYVQSEWCNREMDAFHVADSAANRAPKPSALSRSWLSSIVANQNAEAAETYNELIDLQEGMGDEGGGLRALSENYGELGQIYKALKQGERAENVFLLADKLQQLLLKVKHSGTFVITPDEAGITYDDDLDQIGELYTKLDRIPQALRSYEEALTIRKEASSKRDQLPTSYLKLAVLYDEHYPDKSKAAEYYKLLIAAPRSGDVGGLDYVQALRRLGALYAGDLNEPEKAEPLYNQALTAIDTVHPSFRWPEMHQVFLSLIDLYGQLKKPVELGQTYARFLESTNKLHKMIISGAYRDEKYPVFMASYFKTISDISIFYLEKKDIARAKAAYETAMTETAPPFVGRAQDQANINEMVTALEKLQALLRELKQPDEAAKFDPLITAARARLQELQAQPK